MKLKSAIALFTILGGIGWTVSARAQGGDGDSSGSVTMMGTSGYTSIDSGSTITLTGGSLTSGTLNLLNANATTTTLTGGVINSRPINSFDSAGTIGVLNANSYSGTTTVSSGVLNSTTLTLLNPNTLLTQTPTTYAALPNTTAGILTLSPTLGTETTGSITMMSGGSGSYTGGTNINGGSLVISPTIGSGAVSALTGSGTLNVNGGVLNTNINLALSGSTVFNPIVVGGGTLTLNSTANLTVSNGGVLTVGGMLTGSLNLSNIFSGGTTIVAGSHYPFTIISTYPALTSSYHATDLGDLSDWLAGESGLAAATIDSAMNSGSQSKLLFSLSGFSSISTVAQNLPVLSNLLDSSSGGWTLTQEYGVDTAGDIAVGATAADGTSHALLLSPVPEPASVILAGCGLAALLFARRRFNRRPR